MDIKFSIGIPAFKGTYLKECIYSIINQSYQDFEIVVVDDCSPDPIKEIVEEFSDPRIRYFRNEKNSGPKNVVDNWNLCLKNAKFEFFVLMGDDDKLDPSYLQEFCYLIKKYPSVDIFHCRSKIIGSNSEVVNYTPSCPEFEKLYDYIWHCLNEYRVPYISDFVYRRSSLVAIDGFYKLPLAWASDNITAYMIISNKGIAHVNKALLEYRCHPNTISNSGQEFIKMDAVSLQYAWFKKFLLSKPAISDQQIFYQQIKSIIHRVILKKKVYIIALSLKKNFLVNLIKWIVSRRKFDLSLGLICYSIIVSIKEKKSHQSI